MNDMLKNSIILDTETSSLRPASIFEISYVDINKREAVELLLNPNYVREVTGIEQDVTKLASGSKTTMERVAVSGWDEAIAKETLSALNIPEPADKKEAIALSNKLLPWQNKFLKDNLDAGMFPHVTGQAIDNAQRIAMLSKFGINFVPSSRTYDIEEVITKILPQAFSGKTVWIANTAFECLGENTLLQLEDGNIVEIKDLSTEQNILGTTPNDSCYRELEFIKPVNIVNKGLKKCLEIHPTHGLPIIVSKEHLMFTQRGWLKAQDLTEEDWLVSSMKQFDLPESDEFSDVELEFAGWFIAEGCKTSKKSPSISVAEKEYQDILPSISDDYQYTSSNNKDWRYVAKSGKPRNNPARLLLAKLNLADKYSYEKILDSQLLRLSNRQLGILLGAMYNGDGCINIKSGSIDYTTTSKRLAEQLILVLQRFGILSSMVIVDDKRKDSYHVLYRVVTPIQEAPLFRDKIFVKARKLRELDYMIKDLNKSGRQKTPVRVLPSSLLENQWKEKWKKYVKNLNPRLRARTPVKKELNKLVNRDASGILLSKPVAKIGIDLYKFLSQLIDITPISNTIIWTPIKSINNVGDRIVWDIETNTGEFVANGLIVHNSRHIGAQMDADQSSDVFKQILETRNTRSPNPFYVTGKEVIQARTAASVTGDWTGVWQAYKKYTPKAGETAVRDILDVSRAVTSYGKKLGYLDGPITFHGIGIDLSSQMYARAFGMTDLIGLKEAHKGLEDAAIHERFVLTKGIEIASVLEEVHSGSARGRHYQRLAQKGEGPLNSILKVFSMQEQIQETLHKKSLIQRLSRAYEDFALQGFTVQNINTGKFRAQDQVDYDGKPIKVMMNYPDRSKFTSENTFLDWLSQQDDVKHFKLDPRQEWKAMTTGLAGDNLDKLRMVKEYESKALEALKPDLDTIIPRARRISMPSHFRMPSFDLPKIAPKKMLGVLGAVAGATLLSEMAESEPEQRSVLTYNYSQFLDQIEKMPEGMPGEGIAGQQRSKYTDFGSPYRGPQTSQQVLLNQELLNEREKWLAEEYHIRHYDPQYGLFGLGSIFRFNSGYTYMGGGTPVSSDYRGLQGQNMLSMRLEGGWKIRAEDADTVVLQQKGLINSIASFFGMGRQVSLRLAGLDAPELSHGGRTFGGAQPYAEQATAILAEKLAKADDIEIVYSANDMSYGRLMGAVFADNSNLNYELVQEGAATHLPYGKSDEAMISYAQLQKMEATAYAQKRGVWNSSWGQAFYQLTEATGQRPTLNTLANKSKIAENSSYIELVSALETSRELGKLPANWNNVLTGITEHYDPFSDNVKPEYFNSPAGTYKSALSAMQHDLARQIKTSGNNVNKSPIERSRNKLNNYLAIDSMGNTNSPNNRRKSGFIDTYAIDKTTSANRRLEMAQHQNMVMQNYFVSPIGHYRM